MNERRSVGPDGIVHAVRGLLEAAVQQARAASLPWNYAALLHARRRMGEKGFGVITMRGESLPLTRALVNGLEAVPIWLPATGFVAVEGATTTDESDDAPVDQLVLRAADPMPMPPQIAQALAASEAASREPGADPNEPPILELPTVLHSATVTRTLVLLSEARPHGWPP
ncbi:MAG TPA: hypothetical protein VL287_05975 [Gemmatimonadales bacterium]|jgi:hypothetical protein|nr:hypothetical protein [Gemmatimonadales bacterium]